MTTLSDDATALSRVLERTSGPLLLVGHGYSGAVIAAVRDERVKSLVGGVDVVYDPVGGRHAEPAFRSIAWRGRYLVVGFADGQIPALPWNLPLLKGASIVGVFWGDFVRREPEANARMLGTLASQYARGQIKPVIDTVLPLSRLADAYQRLQDRAILGKIVMVPDELPAA